MGRILLISVRPRFAAMILDGTKTIELRRTRPAVTAGDVLMIYVSSPTKHLVGYSLIDAVVLGSPRQLWDSVKADAGLSLSEYRRYFAGVDTAYGIRLSRVRPLPRPLALEAIKRAWPGFVPPQTYRYICPSDPLTMADESLELRPRAGHQRNCEKSPMARLRSGGACRTHPLRKPER